MRALISLAASLLVAGCHDAATPQLQAPTLVTEAPCGPDRVLANVLATESSLALQCDPAAGSSATRSLLRLDPETREIPHLIDNLSEIDTSASRDPSKHVAVLGDVILVYDDTTVIPLPTGGPGSTRSVGIDGTLLGNFIRSGEHILWTTNSPNGLEIWQASSLLEAPSVHAMLPVDPNKAPQMIGATTDAFYFLMRDAGATPVVQLIEDATFNIEHIVPSIPDPPYSFVESVGGTLFLYADKLYSVSGPNASAHSALECPPNSSSTFVDGLLATTCASSGAGVDVEVTDLSALSSVFYTIDAEESQGATIVGANGQGLFLWNGAKILVAHQASEHR